MMPRNALKDFQCVLMLVMVSSTAPVAAQQSVDPPSCPAADTLLGPPTPAQLKARLSASRRREIDLTSVITGQYTQGPVTAVAKVSGPTPVVDLPAAALRVTVPYRLTDRRDSRLAPMLAVIDDTIEISIGPPILHDWLGSMRPITMPIDVPVTPLQFLMLARATRLEIRWFGQTFKAKAPSLVSLNAMFRLLRCHHIEAGPDFEAVRLGGGH